MPAKRPSPPGGGPFRNGRHASGGPHPRCSGPMSTGSPTIHSCPRCSPRQPNDDASPATDAAAPCPRTRRSRSASGISRSRATGPAASSGSPTLLPSPCRLCGSRLGVRYPSGWLCAVCEWRHGEVVDAELPPPRVDIVYYLRYADRVKIGTTSNPRQRLGGDLARRAARVRARRPEARASPARGVRRRALRPHRVVPAVRARSAPTSTASAAGAEDPWDAATLRWVSEARAR